jgi:sugar/nucleoside kinase (ribokinase family)
MPSLPAPRRLATPGRPRRSAQRGPAVVVVGDLVIDVMLLPDRDLERGTDVPGRVRLRQGGSATTTARWLGRLGARTTLVCAVGRDAIGRSLVAAVEADRVQVRAVRVAGAPTGRIGVLVEPGGERSFVQDRGAALKLRPEDLKPDWFVGVDAVHLPAYSLLDEPLGLAGMAATRLARDASGLVTVDLSSTAPLLARGRRSALALLEEARPDLVFATKDESRALVGAKHDDAGLVEIAPIAVIKRGRKGATILVRDAKRVLRFEVATSAIRATDTTGAGDAFSAGFLYGWLDGRRRGLAPSAALQRGAVAGNRAALRHLSMPPAELPLG